MTAKELNKVPTYLYECKSCGRFEEFQKITDDPLEKCPECSEPVRRIIGSPGIIFKGSGFYSTDNSSSSTTVSNGQKAKENTADSKSETKTGDSGNSEKAS